MRLITLLLVAGTAFAGDYDEFGFGLRFQAALSRFSRYPDVAGSAGASGAALWGSSANPAATGWLGVRGLSPQYSLVEFDAGTVAHVLSASYSWPTASGVFQPSLAYVDTNRATARNGLDFELDIALLELQWGKKTSEDTAWGAGVNFAYSELEFDVGPMPGVESESATVGFRAGWLHQSGESVYLGATLDYAIAFGRTTESDLVTGAGEQRTEDVTHQFLPRLGLQWEYAERSRLYVDYQFALFADDTATLVEHRAFVGIDQMLLEPLAFRAGAVVDDRGSIGWSLGLGIFPSERVFIDFAYQQDMFPEVEPELGGSQVFAISVSITF